MACASSRRPATTRPSTSSRCHSHQVEHSYSIPFLPWSRHCWHRRSIPSPISIAAYAVGSPGSKYRTDKSFDTHSRSIRSRADRKLSADSRFKVGPLSTIPLTRAQNAAHAAYDPAGRIFTVAAIIGRAFFLAAAALSVHHAMLRVAFNALPCERRLAPHSACLRHFSCRALRFVTH